MRSSILLPLIVATACTPASKLTIDASAIAPLTPGAPYSLARVPGFTVGGNAPQSPGQIDEIALSDDYLFLAADWGGLFKIPKYGGGLETIEDGVGPQIRHVTADADHVYWDHETFSSPDDHGHLQLKTRRAVGGNTSVLWEGEQSTFSTNTSVTFQVDSQNLVYVIGNNDLQHLSIERMPLAGGQPTSVATVPTPAGFLAVDGDVYTTIGSDLLRVPAGASAPVKVATLPATGGYGPLTLRAADAQAVYLTDDHHLFAVSRSDGSVTTPLTLPDGENFGFTVIMDDTTVYWAANTPSGWGIHAVPKSGGAVTTIAGGDVFIGGIDQLLQDTHNLFMLHAYGEVLMLPKQPAK